MAAAQILITQPPAGWHNHPGLRDPAEGAPAHTPCPTQSKHVTDAPATS
ncbi:hypothetical protein A2U01_0080650 [Trifolium medium]|uniref:Uncharacterized protein n=1 Tax=Trifolium medium TaxID=97028 RepID=A0A392THI9_9FABA|nr:hypothetical protein [Trifolium medium]